nr:BREX-5 system adenine-specific DNA-methyltransferase PglX [Haloferax sp. Atlit-6N]
MPDEDDQDAPSFDHPSELRVIDPACGSGHFLLYAFDILERIWWAETDLDRSEIPAKILEHNLYGVDIDLRSCQLSAFNLYLKARTRAEEENGDFEMPNVGIVCADARVAEVEEAVAVLDEITGEGTDVREALDEIIEEFQTTEALGSLLDVQSTLSEEFMDQQTDIMEWGGEGPHTLNGFLRQLREAVDEQTSDSFGDQNLRSFLNLLVVLTQDYDVALMNPPYGSKARMPAAVRDYVREHYRYAREYYINFFEACNRLVKDGGRVSMIVPRTFMFKSTFENFRGDFIGKQGSFDFLTEFGNGVLDNATVRTAGTVVRIGDRDTEDPTGTFFRLHDVDTNHKEDKFIAAAFDQHQSNIERKFTRKTSEFELIPGNPLSYWVPPALRSLYTSPTVFDAANANLDDRESLGVAKVGLQTGDNGRFVRKFWESPDFEYWIPFAKGGEDAWILPQVNLTVGWGETGADIRRYEGSRPQNTQYFFREALTYTYMKESGRRFGYLHPDSIFGRAGCAYIPSENTWGVLSYANSNLTTYLMLSQTPDRQWEVGYVSKLPWNDKIGRNSKLASLSREAVGHLLSERQYDFSSPHYGGPVLLAVLGITEQLPQYDHPHRNLRDELELNEPTELLDTDASIEDLGTASARHLEQIKLNLQSCADAIDDAVFDSFDITEDQRETVLQEIALRTNEDPCKRENYDPDGITEPSEDFPEMVKDLLLHLAIRVVHEDDDGIVPISSVENEADLLSRIEGEFDRLFDQHASARLAEVDQILGSRTADEEAYPNLREWLKDDLFDYHVSTFERTPILWRLTTDRLVSDPEGEGFACLVDYHQLDDGVFDRLQNRYIEPRKALLRERRSSANRRRGDDSLSASEKAAAAEEYARCESGLEQIGVFEERLSELAQSSPREWPRENQETAEDAVQSVVSFREETASRLKTLEELAELDDVDMGDLFSPSFYETVQKNQEEWLDALDELQSAFEAYAADGSEPVEAHLYDLFDYYDDLVGSTHYASNGILFMTYYFGKFEDAGQAKIGDGGVSKRERLLSELATGLNEYEELANEITKACDAVASDISTDWEERALAEITTAGYQPNRKHGVEINIRPLADAKVVPKTVEDDVL